MRGVNLTFFEAMHGVKKEISIQKEEICSDCQGSGAKNKSDIDRCRNCNGTGSETVSKRSIFGLIQQQQTCSHCQG